MINIKHILIPTDFSDVATEAVSFAFEMARMHDASLDIVHVFEEPAFPSFYDAGALMLYGKVPDIRKQAQAALDELVAPFKKEGNITIRTHLLDGHAADRICSFAIEEHIDLIVIPTFGLTGIKHVLMGSVAERVVRQAHCPVYVYKPPPSNA